MLVAAIIYSAREKEIRATLKMTATLRTHLAAATEAVLVRTVDMKMELNFFIIMCSFIKVCFAQFHEAESE